MVTPNLFQPVLTPKIGVTQIWKVLGSFEALDNLTNSKTFNFSPIDFDSDSMLALEADITGAQNINLEVQVNGITSGVYFQDGDIIDTFPSAKIIIDINSANSFRVANSIIEAGRNAVLIYYFQLNKAGSSTFVSTIIDANRLSILSGGRSYRTTGKINQNISSISSIRVFTTPITRFFALGSRMTLYKVAR